MEMQKAKQMMGQNRVKIDTNWGQMAKAIKRERQESDHGIFRQ